MASFNVPCKGHRENVWEKGSCKSLRLLQHGLCNLTWLPIAEVHTQICSVTEFLDSTMFSAGYLRSSTFPHRKQIGLHSVLEELSCMEINMNQDKNNPVQKKLWVYLLKISGPPNPHYESHDTDIYTKGPSHQLSWQYPLIWALKRLFQGQVSEFWRIPCSLERAVLRFVTPRQQPLPASGSPACAQCALQESAGPGPRLDPAGSPASPERCCGRRMKLAPPLGQIW